MNRRVHNKDIFIFIIFKNSKPKLSNKTMEELIYTFYKYSNAIHVNF